MSETRTGGCLCGQSRYEATEPPRFSITCYCRDCQKATGTGHAPSFAVNRTAVTKSGPLRTFTNKAASGNDVELGFCSNCSSPIYKTTTLAPDLIFLFAGTLDDPTQFKDAEPVYDDSRQPWDKN